MKTIWVRPERLNDRQKLVEWEAKGQNNYFDPDVLSYPATTALVAHSDHIILYLPVQKVIMLESLAINPEVGKDGKPLVTDHEVSVALKEAVINLAFEGQVNGVGEIYFMGTNEQTNKFAAKHGFEQLPWVPYRIKTFRLGETNENLQENSTGSKDGGDPQ